MRSLLWAALLWPVYFFSPMANAWDCSLVTSNTTIPAPAPTITIPHNLPVGSEIGSQVTTGEIAAYSCFNSEGGDITSQSFGVQAFGEYATTINNRRVYKTNIEGIGYAVGGVDTSACHATGWVSGTNTMRARPETYALCTNPSKEVSMQPKGKVMVTYYKIADITGSGTVESKLVGALVLLNNLLLWEPSNSNVTSTSFTITTLGCTVEKTLISVPMGEVPGNVFSGKGSTPGDSYTQSFDLPLKCHAGTKVTMKIEGNVNDAAKGVLNITRNSEDDAKGVGIQMLYNNQPLALGTPIMTGTSSAGGSYNIPLKARYYQTENKLTGGYANGTATFTMTYD